MANSFEYQSKMELFASLKLTKEKIQRIKGGASELNESGRLDTIWEEEEID